MASAKYDYEEMKVRYLESSEIEIEHFLRTYLDLPVNKPISGTLKTKTKGWRDEKLEFKKKLTEKAMEQVLNDPKMIMSQAELIQLKYMILKIAFKGIKEFDSLVDFDPAGTAVIGRNASGLKTIWEMAKIELGEPTTVSQNSNLNQNISLDDLTKELNKLNDVN